jgi:ubiquinone/menaquinone biosynthesis C-methylase UbiE
VEAKKAVSQSPGRPQDVSYTQGNVLSLPFADNTFDLVVTSGALEYVPLKDGLDELARVIAPEGHLLHLPCRPTPASAFLEILFRFKSHSPRAIVKNTERHFRVVHHYNFRPLEIIGWSKSAILAQKAQSTFTSPALSE